MPQHSRRVPFARLFAAAVVALILVVVGPRVGTSLWQPSGVSGTDLRPTPTVDQGLTTPAASGTPGTPRLPGSTTTLDLLAGLPIKGRAPKTGYDRDQFGPRWADTDRNGCDTRNDTLRRDLTDVVLKPGTHGCVVLGGLLADPYSGKTIHFERGPDTSLFVQIDHVVPLFDAWQKGAQQWPEGKRVEFANDPLNLLAVAGELNQQKGAGDAATWLPPNKSFRCSYAAIQVRVKAKYDLWVTAAEKEALTGILTRCPRP